MLRLGPYSIEHKHHGYQLKAYFFEPDVLDLYRDNPHYHFEETRFWTKEPLPISAQDCKKLGLKVIDIESDQTLQDLILTVHHCYMHTFANSPAIKITEN